MGKKRRVLRNPKFKHLRKHPKYAGMVASNKQKIEEIQETIEEVTEPAESIPTPVLETAAEVVVEKLKPKLRRTRKKTTIAKKTTAKRRIIKKKVEEIE